MVQFQEYNGDNSGFIDERELMQLFVKMDIQISSKEMGKMVEEIDQDGNGLIDFNEFVQVDLLII